jgi:demethylmenaquinone methyltransferase/2-methoxy-6-polyprenyl-1,4-benzoquinol methylase
VPYRYYLHRILPIIAGIVTRERAAYQYLGDSIEKFPAGQAMTSMIESCGFNSAAALPLTGGIVSLYTGVRAIS